MNNHFDTGTIVRDISFRARYRWYLWTGRMSDKWYEFVHDEAERLGMFDDFARNLDFVDPIPSLVADGLD